MRTVQAFLLLACVTFAVNCQKGTPIYICANNLLELSYQVKQVIDKQDFTNLKAQLAIVPLAQQTLLLCKPVIAAIKLTLKLKATEQLRGLSRSSPEANPVKVNSSGCQREMVSSYEALNSSTGVVLAQPPDLKRLTTELARAGMDYSRLNAACT